jgi:hypothetical protein
MNNKHKDLLSQNENVLKFFVYNQLVAKKDQKNESAFSKLFKSVFRW